MDVLRDREYAVKFGKFTVIFFSGFDEPTIRGEALVYLKDSRFVDFITAVRDMITKNCMDKDTYKIIVDYAISIYGDGKKFGCFEPAQLLTLTLHEIAKFGLLKK